LELKKEKTKREHPNSFLGLLGGGWGEVGTEAVGGRMIVYKVKAAERINKNHNSKLVPATVEARKTPKGGDKEGGYWFKRKK